MDVSQGWRVRHRLLYSWETKIPLRVNCRATMIRRKERERSAQSKKKEELSMLGLSVSEGVKGNAWRRAAVREEGSGRKKTEAKGPP